MFYLSFIWVLPEFYLSFTRVLPEFYLILLEFYQSFTWVFPEFYLSFTRVLCFTMLHVHTFIHFSSKIKTIYVHVQYTGKQQIHWYLQAVIYNFQQTQKKNKYNFKNLVTRDYHFRELVYHLKALSMNKNPATGCIFSATKMQH
jgi:hypothetical protein